jgi:GNAT superfamily N-acetyltransferase
MMVHPDYRGLRLGRRLYDYRKELCEELNSAKHRLLAAGCPIFHKFDDLTAKEYIQER